MPYLFKECAVCGSMEIPYKYNSQAKPICAECCGEKKITIPKPFMAEKKQGRNEICHCGSVKNIKIAVYEKSNFHNHIHF